MDISLHCTIRVQKSCFRKKPKDRGLSQTPNTIAKKVDWYQMAILIQHQQSLREKCKKGTNCLAWILSGYLPDIRTSRPISWEHIVKTAASTVGLPPVPG